MYVDKQSEFSDAQAVTATAISTNVMDLNPMASANTLQDIGAGEPVWLVVSVQTAATAAGAATVVFSLESDSTADLATSPTVHFTSATIGKATLIAGYTAVAIRLPLGDYERYLGVRYTVATGPLTAGNFDAFLTKDVNVLKYYANGFSVS